MKKSQLKYTAIGIISKQLETLFQPTIVFCMSSGYVKHGGRKKRAASSETTVTVTDFRL